MQALFIVIYFILVLVHFRHFNYNNFAMLGLGMGIGLWLACSCKVSKTVKSLSFRAGVFKLWVWAHCGSHSVMRWAVESRLAVE